MKEVTRHIVMHPDCNATKHLFGGRLLAWIDEAAAMYAMCQTKSKHIVTAYFGGLDFKVPIPLGSVVRIYCTTTHKGTKSIKVSVTCKIQNFESGIEVIAAENELVFVKVDEQGTPQLINWGHKCTCR